MGWEPCEIFKIGCVRKKLAIIGASYLQVPLVKKAKTMGIETHVFAWEEGAVAKNIADYFYPISILSLDKILQMCTDIQIDGITSIGSDIAMPTVNFIAEKLRLIGNNAFCTAVTTDKYEMRRQLSMHAIHCPNFLKTTQYSKFTESDYSKLHFPLIVKPTDRSGSRGVTKVNNKTELLNAVDRALEESIKKTAIVEEFIIGNEISVEMISWKGEHYFLAVTDKVTTGAPYFVEIEQHEPSLISETIKINVIELVKNALTALGVEYGASHSELIIDKNGGLHIVEIGARMGGDNIGACLVEMSTGYDFVEDVINVALGIEPKVEMPVKNHAGIYYLTPPKGTIKSISVKTDLMPQIKNYDIFVNPGDHVDFPVKDSSQRSGYVLYQSDSAFTLKDLSAVIKFQIEEDSLQII